MQTYRNGKRIMKMPTSAPAGAPNIELGPFVLAAETTLMPMILTDAQDPMDIVAFANDGFLALTGLSRDAVVGRALGLVLADVIDASFVAAITSALSGGLDGSWELQCRRIGGDEFPVTAFLSPLRDRAGVSRQNFLSFVPLGARFDRLLKQRNEFQTLYENAPGFIAMAEGPEHRFILANASYKRFVGRADLEGLTVAEALPEIAAQGFVGILDDVFRTGKPYCGKSIPFDLASPETGHLERRYADFVYQPVRGADQDITGIFCEGYDVTAEHEAAQDLAELQGRMIHLSRVNAMGTMATTLAHELNQPLSAITNYCAGGLRLMQKGGDQPEPVAAALKAIAEAAQHASYIIRTLTELTRRDEPARSSFNLKGAIDECIRLVQAASCTDVEISNLVPGDIEITADRIQFQQVTINLLQNSCDALASERIKQVRVTTSRTQGHVTVCIEDSGAGVSSKAVEDIFAWGLSTKESGMGLGLSICRTIIEAHRGRIWVEGNPNGGAKFCFTLPATGP